MINTVVTYLQLHDCQAKLAQCENDVKIRIAEIASLQQKCDNYEEVSLSCAPRSVLTEHIYLGADTASLAARENRPRTNQIAFDRDSRRRVR